MNLLIVLLIGSLLLSGCLETTFDEREYSFDELPPSQILVLEYPTGYVILGDFCLDEWPDSCIFVAKYKLKPFDSGKEVEKK